MNEIIKNIEAEQLKATVDQFEVWNADATLSC